MREGARVRDFLRRIYINKKYLFRGEGSGGGGGGSRIGDFIYKDSISKKKKLFFFLFFFWGGGGGKLFFSGVRDKS